MGGASSPMAGPSLEEIGGHGDLLSLTVSPPPQPPSLQAPVAFVNGERLPGASPPSHRRRRGRSFWSNSRVLIFLIQKLLLIMIPKIQSLGLDRTAFSVGDERGSGSGPMNASCASARALGVEALLDADRGGGSTLGSHGGRVEVLRSGQGSEGGRGGLASRGRGGLAILAFDVVQICESGLDLEGVRVIDDPSVVGLLDSSPEIRLSERGEALIQDSSWVNRDLRKGKAPMVVTDPAQIRDAGRVRGRGGRLQERLHLGGRRCSGPGAHALGSILGRLRDRARRGERKPANSDLSPSLSSMETTATCSPAAVAGMGMEDALSQVDPFLVEALEKPRHRLTVLWMELDIQKFIQSSDQYQYEFQHLPTSYLRRAAHRVAQHYGLQTIAVDNTIDGLGSRVVARRTPESRFPAVCLSEVPAKQPGKETAEQVKIAIRPRPRKSLDHSNDPGNKVNPFRTVEERKEEYDKARARIFSGSAIPDTEGLVPYVPSAADGRSSCSSGDEQECASRVAIFRDREKDRSDPDYDRRNGRYLRGPTPSQTFSLGGCNVLQQPFLHYETGTSFSQTGQLPRNPTSVGYGPANPTMDPFCAFGSNQIPRDALFMAWPNPAAMMYAHPYEHFRHAVVQVGQAPFYQQPLSFEHRQNC